MSTARQPRIVLALALTGIALASLWVALWIGARNRTAMRSAAAAALSRVEFAAPVQGRGTITREQVQAQLGDPQKLHAVLPSFISQTDILVCIEARAKSTDLVCVVSALGFRLGLGADRSVREVTQSELRAWAHTNLTSH